MAALALARARGRLPEGAAPPTIFKFDPSQMPIYETAFSSAAITLVELRERVAKAALGGDERSRARHLSRNKLLPRDRVERLLDPGSPLLEIGQLPANGLDNDESESGAAYIFSRASS